MLLRFSFKITSQKDSPSKEKKGERNGDTETPVIEDYVSSCSRIKRFRPKTLLLTSNGKRFSIPSVA